MGIISLFPKIKGLTFDYFTSGTLHSHQALSNHT